MTTDSLMKLCKENPNKLVKLLPLEVTKQLKDWAVIYAPIIHVKEVPLKQGVTLEAWLPFLKDLSEDEHFSNQLYISISNTKGVFYSDKVLLKFYFMMEEEQ